MFEKVITGITTAALVAVCGAATYSLIVDANTSKRKVALLESIEDKAAANEHPAE